MKLHYYFVLVCSIALFVTEAFPQEKTDSLIADYRIMQFERVVDNLNKFFETNPIFLDEQPFMDSPTGKIFMLYKHISPIVISYDIKKTESLISPLYGYITIDIPNRLINKEGGYTRVEDCLADKTFTKWKTMGGKEYIVPATLKYNFAFQKGLWVFQSIEAYHNEIYDDDWFRQENKHWIDAAINAVLKK